MNLIKKQLFISLLICSNILFAGEIKNHRQVQEATALFEIWLEAQRDYHQLPGLTMAVVHDQEIIWSGGYGYANPYKQISSSSTTIHSICSISKLFTGIAVMQLRDQEKLHLDDPLSKHLPWFNIENTYPGWGMATIRNILTHSSGLPRESDYPYWTGPDFPFPSSEKIVEQLSNQETLYPADKYFQYSNLGLSLAGEVVAAVSGIPFNDFIQDNILQPLAMTDTRPVMPKSLYGDQLAIGHEALNRTGERPAVSLFNAEGIGPAAGFSSTASDLAKFASWQFRVLDGKDEVLKPNTLREMHRVHFLDEDWSPAWGLGFSIWKSDEKKFIGHGGSCPGYRSQLLLQTNQKIATIFMTNASGVNARMYAQKAYEMFESAIASSEAKEKPKLLKNRFKKYLGHYSDAPWGGESVVVSWEGELAILNLPTESPLDVTKLHYVSGNTFKRIRNSDDPKHLQILGEEIEFEVDRSGNVIAVWQHSNYSKKIK